MVPLNKARDSPLKACIGYGFAMTQARVLARADGGTEVMWNRQRFES